MDEHRVPAVLQRLGTLQAARPWHFLLLAVCSLLPALWGIFGHGGLGFRPDFSELLPDDKDSVIEMRRLSARLPGASTLTIVAQVEGGGNRAALKAFVEALVPRLRSMGAEKVGAVDYGVHDARAFFEQHKLLFADLEDLKRAHSEVLTRYDYEVARAGGYLDDDEDAPAAFTAESVEQALRGGRGKAKEGPDPFPDGYFMNQEGTLIAVLVRTPVTGKAAKAALRKEVEQAVAALAPRAFDPTMTIGYTGDFVTGEEEYDAVIKDLVHVGGWGLAGVLLSTVLFFMRLRTVFAMGATILVALVWTFGLTRLTIGYLNSSTGFLVSIIAGNGINYAIMYMARYMEARRDQGADVGEAILVAHRDSWIPTLAGSATAMLAYGSLILTDFRGFKHFGIISGYGMILCWVATYLFLPAILAATERIRPSFGRESRATRLRGYYGIGFARLARFAPRTLIVAGAVATLGTVYASARYLVDDPMEYDMRKVRTEWTSLSAPRELGARVGAITGRMALDGMAVVTDRVDQVPLLEQELQARWEQAPEGEKPFDKVVTIFSLIPSHQEEKLRLIHELRDRLERARARGAIGAQDWAKLEPHLPKGELVPLRIADLPEPVARPFTERDGTRGCIVYIAPSSGWSVWNARYLMRWADSYRTTRLPTGEVIKGSGRAVIFADMIKTIGEDAPKAIGFSAIGSVLVILLAFRFRRAAWGVFLPWLVGLAGLLTWLYVSDTKLNFLNFVSIPITIGIGAEYAHNMMQRYRVEGPSRIYHVTVETGGAVVLCSLTTTIGYLALTLSRNQGIRSFGMASAVGELTCVIGAVLLLPAGQFLLARRESKAGLQGIVAPATGHGFSETGAISG